jgi:heme-degrading monooxygenase HmoA
MRERIASAPNQPGFVAVQLCMPADEMSERVIIGTWESRAHWEAWHATDEFQRTRELLEEPNAKTKDERWYEVVLESRAPSRG